MAGWIGPGWTATAVDRSFEDIGAMPGPRQAVTRTLVGDARRLPFADGAFDVVLALDVLEHIARVTGLRWLTNWSAPHAGG